MSNQEHDRVLGETAVKLGFVTQKELDTALENQEVDAAIGQNKPICGYLLESGKLTKDQIAKILATKERSDLEKKLREKDRASNDIKFCFNTCTVDVPYGDFGEIPFAIINDIIEKSGLDQGMVFLFPLESDVSLSILPYTGNCLSGQGGRCKMFFEEVQDGNAPKTLFSRFLIGREVSFPFFEKKVELNQDEHIVVSALMQKDVLDRKANVRIVMHGTAVQPESREKNLSQSEKKISRNEISM